MNHYTSGVDYFCSDANKPAETDIRCAACGALLKGEKRECYHSWVSAMAKHKSWAWDYMCPHVGKKGHDHLVALVKEIDHTVSEKVRALIESELQEKKKEFNARTTNKKRRV